MKIGIIGLGVVGGVLHNWLAQHTKHQIFVYDPPKGLCHSLKECDVIFISVPVPANDGGQDLTILKQSVLKAKQYTNNVFIRSTVLPGTNDALGTIAMPEFLTERTAYADFCSLPIVIGKGFHALGDRDLKSLFPGKEIIITSNVEAEISKFAHNCFGATKVTYFNIIEELCRKHGAEYKNVLLGAMITGFIEKTHTRVPGPDGEHGYGGKCFPENIKAMKEYLKNPSLKMDHASLFFETIDISNSRYRSGILPRVEMYMEHEA